MMMRRILAFLSYNLFTSINPLICWNSRIQISNRQKQMRINRCLKAIVRKSRTLCFRKSVSSSGTNNRHIQITVSDRTYICFKVLYCNHNFHMPVSSKSLSVTVCLGYCSNIVEGFLLNFISMITGIWHSIR